MSRKARKLDVACPNTDCRAFNKVGLLNMVRNGKRPNGTQNYRCTECNRQVVRTYGTPFYRRKLPKKEIINMTKMFVEKTSFRGIARTTGHHLDTVRSFASSAAEHCAAITDFLLHDVKLGVLEIDEFWSFVKKNKKMLPKHFSRTLNKVMRTLTSRSKGKRVFS